MSYKVTMQYDAYWNMNPKNNCAQHSEPYVQHTLKNESLREG